MLYNLKPSYKISVFLRFFENWPMNSKENENAANYTILFHGELYGKKTHQIHHVDLLSMQLREQVRV